MSREKLRVGIAGYGAVGKIRFAVLSQIENLEIVCISDQNIDNATQLPSNIKTYNDFEIMISQENLDVIFIALPNYLASKATIMALHRGINIFCEKPPARNPQEFESVIAVAKTKPHLKLMYGFNHRYHPSVKKASEVINSGELGTILNMRGEYGKSAIIKFDRNEWRAMRKHSGGGILLDQGIHLLDLMRFFGEEFTAVNSIVKNSYWNYDVEDNAYAFLDDTSWSEETNLFINCVQNNLEIQSGNFDEARKTLNLVYKIYSSDLDWNEKYEIEKVF